MGSALSVKNYESPADRRLAGGFLADTSYEQGGGNRPAERVKPRATAEENREGQRVRRTQLADKPGMEADRIRKTRRGTQRGVFVSSDAGQVGMPSRS